MSGQKSGPTVMDVDSNLYRTSVIGHITVFAENLKTTKYINGTPIPRILDNATWSTTQSGAIAPPLYLLGQDNYVDKYGYLYNWYAVNSDRLCPVGWDILDYKVFIRELGLSIGSGTYGTSQSELIVIDGINHFKSQDLNIGTGKWV